MTSRFLPVMLSGAFAERGVETSSLACGSLRARQPNGDGVIGSGRCAAIRSRMHWFFGCRGLSGAFARSALGQGVDVVSLTDGLVRVVAEGGPEGSQRDGGV